MDARRAERPGGAVVVERVRSATSAALDVDRVAHRFGRRWVLRGCSLRVAAGEAVALAGSNGAGKTTLLRIVSTLLRPTRGSVSVFGHPASREPDEIRAAVGLLGHVPALYDDLTATENLEFACRMRGRRPDEPAIAAVLERVGLAAHRAERVRGFSAGMRRRVALARVLLHRPRLLLMDEPYASFDVHGIELVQTVVRETVERGGAALVATHDVPRALNVVHRVAYVEDGLLRLDEAPATERRRETAVAVPGDVEVG